MSIKQISFKHGWFYFYRIHEPKTQALTKEFPTLNKFLYDVFGDCPDEYFNEGPRSSALKFPLNINLEAIEGDHEVKLLTNQGLEANATRYKSAHSKVQVHMLEEDDMTIGVEVPLWLNADEYEGYEKLFSTSLPLTGHIDVLRIQDGKIWVWDYKPNAKREKYAATQVYFYALMLSVRTGISLDHFMCGYFDSADAYVFDPAKDSIVEN